MGGAKRVSLSLALYLCVIACLVDNVLRGASVFNACGGGIGAASISQNSAQAGAKAAADDVCNPALLCTELLSLQVLIFCKSLAHEHEVDSRVALVLEEK